MDFVQGLAPGLCLGVVLVFALGWWFDRSDERELRKMARDAAAFGVGVMRDGKRIDPRDIYKR